jgi:hypothetical protein
MCRAPTVLKADRSELFMYISPYFKCLAFIGNVDYALLNFMADWFPIESREKLGINEREAAQEQLEELGLSGQGCLVM